MKDVDAASRFWDREVQEQTHVSWMADPLVRHYINEAISGSPHLWPMDWFEQFTNRRRFRRVLSIGCGSGAFERDMMKRGLADRIDALDGSTHSLHIARTTAEAEGYRGTIGYFACDFNEPVLPRGTFDLVVFHQSMHHVAKLEKVLREVLLSLAPGGLLYIDEYVGPSRHDWSFELLKPHEAAYQLVPPEARIVPTLPLPIVYEDPSEAIRSSEIEEQLAIGFETIEERGYGGNLLAIFFPSIHWSIAPAGLVEKLIDAERQLLRSGHRSYHKVAFLRPKSGVAKQLARFRYFLEPKVKRVGREVRRLVG